MSSTCTNGLCNGGKIVVVDKGKRYEVNCPECTARTSRAAPDGR